MSSTYELPDSVTPRLPGEPGVWMFIIGDVLIFSLLFSVFVYDRSQEVALFVEQQQLLNQTLGLCNTLLLLTSSWLVALAVHSARTGQLARARGCFGLATLGGIGFVVIKYFEWSDKLAAGLTIETNNFFMYYYVMTGIHLMHMLIGIGVLVFLWQSVRDAEFDSQDVAVLESGACFWHLVDILWIALFALLYLMR
jgi:nitric oxide reductase NorE protein